MQLIFDLAIATLLIASTYALMGLAFKLSYSINKFFDLGFAGYAIVGSYVYLTLTKLFSFSLPYWMALIVSLFVSMLLGYLIHRFIYMKFYAKNSPTMILMIVSLGIMSILQSVISIFFTSNIQTINWYTSNVTYTNIIATLIIYAIVLAVMYRTRLGLMYRALVDSESLGEAVGLPHNKIKLIVYAAAVTIASFAGLLHTFDSTVSPVAGMTLMLNGVIVGILTGERNFIYILVASLTLATLNTLSVWYVGGEWKDAISFLILIIVLAFKPKFVFGKAN